ncbi:MAG: hypothetical protein JNK15_20075 [Planctomycetes bacterium]|nr:hypothetical protein [Planctomycetota bacterium]
METRTLFALVSCAAPALAQDVPATDLSGAEHGSMREALGRVGSRLDDWIDRFRLSGFVATRAFDTERGGSRPNGAIGVQAATLFVDVAVKDVASAFLELRYDYFTEAGQNEAGIGEAYVTLPDVCQLGSGNAMSLRVGRFDLPFGEYYLQEDPDQNKLVGFPAAIPYRWDEGIEAFGELGGLGFTAAVTDGTYSRNSDSNGGIGPAVTLRLHARPTDHLYLSLSGIHIHEAGSSALCFGGSVITPVSGSITGTSPSPTVRSTLGSFDVRWQLADTLHLQTSVGGGQVDDESDVFDRAILWFMVEPSWTVAPQWAVTARVSGAGTFDDRDGFEFEGRPYANGATYGFELASLQRLQLGVSHTIGKGLTAKAEVGWDRLTAIEQSFLPDDTRMFTAIELVFAF